MHFDWFLMHQRFFWKCTVYKTQLKKMLYHVLCKLFYAGTKKPVNATCCNVLVRTRPTGTNAFFIGHVSSLYCKSQQNACKHPQCEKALCISKVLCNT